MDVSNEIYGLMPMDCSLDEPDEEPDYTGVLEWEIPPSTWPQHDPCFESAWAAECGHFEVAGVEPEDPIIVSEIDEYPTPLCAAPLTISCDGDTIELPGWGCGNDCQEECGYIDILN